MYLVCQHFSQLVRIEAVGERVKRLFLLVSVHLQALPLEHGSSIVGQGQIKRLRNATASVDAQMWKIKKSRTLL